MRSCISNGRLINPATDFDGIADIIIEDGKITKIVEKEADRDEEHFDEIIDASGKWVVPGFIDLHVHFREPGFEYKEDMKSGALAAARGGFTTVCVMPNTKPAIDSAEIVEYVNEKAKQGCGVNILAIGAITEGQDGQRLTDFAAMKQAAGGICALSEDGKSVMSSGVMKTAMEEAKKLDLPIFAHTEDIELAAGGVMNEGEAARRMGVKGIPSEAEEIIAIRDILLSKNTGCKLHLCHISTKGSVELIRQAKAHGIHVTAETAPHYFTLTDEDVKDTNFKMNPPLRGREDVKAIVEGLRDGTLDVIATDHAPHHEKEKDRPFAAAPFGIVGLETSFAVSYTELVGKGFLSSLGLIDLMSWKPAQILGIDKGDLSVGKTADITILDVEREYEIDPFQFYSKSRNTPFFGKKVFGRVLRTLVEGKTIFYEK